MYDMRINAAILVMSGVCLATATPNAGQNTAGKTVWTGVKNPLAQKHLGYKPLVSFEEGLRRTVDWYRNETRAAGA